VGWLASVIGMEDVKILYVADIIFLTFSIKANIYQMKVLSSQNSRNLPMKGYNKDIYIYIYICNYTALRS
jgi:hypothetical protein